MLLPEIDVPPTNLERRLFSVPEYQGRERLIGLSIPPD